MAVKDLTSPLQKIIMLSSKKSMGRNSAVPISLDKVNLVHVHKLIDASAKDILSQAKEEGR